MTVPPVYSDEQDCPTSSSLLLQAKASNQAAWDRLVSLYSPLIYRWCRRAGLQPADAADVGQEVFRAVARKLNDFRRTGPGDTFRGWLRTITQNKIRDHARIRLVPLMQDKWLDAQRTPERESAGEVEQQEEVRDSHVLLWRAVELIRSEFEPVTWRAFWLVSVEARLPRDVAADLCVSVNAVYLAKSRVLRRLREELGTFDPSDL